jgi:hypothetical protein
MEIHPFLKAGESIFRHGCLFAFLDDLVKFSEIYLF